MSAGAAVSIGSPCRPRCVVVTPDDIRLAMPLQLVKAEEVEPEGGFCVTSDDCFSKILAAVHGEAAAPTFAIALPCEQSRAGRLGSFGSPNVVPNVPLTAPPPAQQQYLTVHDVWGAADESPSSPTRSFSSFGSSMNLGRTPDDIARLLLGGVNASLLQIRHSQKFCPSTPGQPSSPFVADFQQHRQHGDVLFRHVLKRVTAKLMDRSIVSDSAGCEAGEGGECIIPEKERLLTNFQASVTMLEFVNEEIVDLLVGADKLSTALAESPTGAFSVSAADATSPTEVPQPRGVSPVENESFGDAAVFFELRTTVDDDSPFEDTTSSAGSFAFISSPLGSTEGACRAAGGDGSPEATAQTKSPMGSGSSCLSSSRKAPQAAAPRRESSSALKLRSSGSGGLGVFVDGASSLSIADSNDLGRIVSLGLSRRDELILARGSSGAVSHTVLVVRFQRGVLGESFVTETELVLVDACIPTPSVAPPGSGSDLFMRKGIQSANALSRLIGSISSEGSTASCRGKAAAGKPSDSAKTIRSAIKKESLLTRFLAERLDGNVVLYTVVHLFGGIQTLSPSVIASLSKIKQLQDSMVNIVDPSRSTKEVAVTSHAIQNDLRRLRQSLKVLQEEQAKERSLPNTTSVYGKKMVALKKQIVQHEDRLNELRQFLSKRMLSFSRLKVKCERQRLMLETLHNELEGKSNAAVELKQVSRELEESQHAHRQLVGQLDGAMRSVNEATSQLHHLRSASSFLETDMQRRSREALSSSEEIQRQRRNFFRQIFVSATETVKLQREEVPIRMGVQRLAAVERLLQAKHDVKSKHLLQEARCVGELEQHERSTHARIMQLMFAEEACRGGTAPEDNEAAAIEAFTCAMAGDVASAKQELAELDLMVSIFAKEAADAGEQRRVIKESTALSLSELLEMESRIENASACIPELVKQEETELRKQENLSSLLHSARNELDLNVRIGKHIEAEISTVEAEIVQQHVAMNSLMAEDAALKVELHEACNQYDAVLEEYVRLCDRFSICAPDVFPSAKSMCESIGSHA